MNACARAARSQQSEAFSDSTAHFIIHFVAFSCVGPAASLLRQHMIGGQALPGGLFIAAHTANLARRHGQWPYV